MEGKGRVALVTGGSRGIGAAIAMRLAADGFIVHIAYRASAAAAREIAETIEENGGCARLHRTDVSDEANVAELVDDIAAHDGTVHVLVNNAGVIDDELLALTKTATWDRVLGVNLTGPFLTSRAVLPLMLAEGWGRIVNISSNSVRIPGPGQTAYAASKGGIEALTRALAAEVGRKGIRVNAVAPGRIRTDMTDAIALRGHGGQPGGSWGTPADVAGMVAFLASEEADYIQGQTFTVDGGRLITRNAPGKRGEVRGL
jgi:3-oxoacyl-[acyl-carrier protein] reductase